MKAHVAVVTGLLATSSPKVPPIAAVQRFDELFSSLPVVESDRNVACGFANKLCSEADLVSWSGVIQQWDAIGNSETRALVLVRQVCDWCVIADDLLAGWDGVHARNMYKLCSRAALGAKTMLGMDGYYDNEIWIAVSYTHLTLPTKA